jgi:hypothetical protein
MESKQNRVRKISVSGFPFRMMVRVASLLCAWGQFALSQAEASDEMANALRQNVVRIKTTMSTHEENGFGFVVGEKSGQLYIATAHHVVASSDPDTTTLKVEVEFFERRGKMYKAELLGTHDAARDLAVLTVPPPAGVTWTKKCMAGPEKQKRGVPVWSIGRVQDWKIPVEPGHVASDTSPDWMLNLEGTVVQPGSSGGPVVSDSGIIGMIEQDSAGNTRALSIDLIQRDFQSWNHPWGLQFVAAATSPVVHPPVVPPPSDAEAITKVIQTYADAYSHRDANALWNIWPLLPAKTKQRIENDFQSAASIKMTVDPGTPNIEADNASVQGQFTQVFTPRKGNPHPQSGDIKFSLTKNNGAWIIVDVK